MGVPGQHDVVDNALLPQPAIKPTPVSRVPTPAGGVDLRSARIDAQPRLQGLAVLVVKRRVNGADLRQIDLVDDDVVSHSACLRPEQRCLQPLPLLVAENLHLGRIVVTVATDVDEHDLGNIPIRQRAVAVERIVPTRDGHIGIRTRWRRKLPGAIRNR